MAAAQSIAAATKSRVIKRASLDEVVLDTTVQPKAIPTPPTAACSTSTANNASTQHKTPASRCARATHGYRGVEPAADIRLRVSHTRKLPKTLKKLLKRRQVVEPMSAP